MDSREDLVSGGISTGFFCCSWPLPSDSSKPSLKERLLCPNAFANCGNLLPPKSRKITPTMRIQIIGLSGRNNINITNSSFMKNDNRVSNECADEDQVRRR